MKNLSSPDRRGPKGKHIESATEFGRAVQKARLEKRLTTPELAELVGVTDASITQTEAGQTLPRRPTVKSYEENLGVALMGVWERDMQRRKASKAPTEKRQSIKAAKAPAHRPTEHAQRPAALPVPEDGKAASGMADDESLDRIQDWAKEQPEHKAAVKKRRKPPKVGK